MNLPQRRLLTLSALVAGVCFIAGALFSSQLPKVRSLILVKIEQESREHLPVRVLPGSIDVTFFPLGATLKHVSLIPKDEIKPFLGSASFDTIAVTVSPWQLLRGRLRLNELSISGAHIDATIPPAKKKSGPPLEGLFDLLSQIPINSISLNDVGARLRLIDPKMTFEIDDVDLIAEKQRGNTLRVELNSGSVQVLSAGAGTAPSLKMDFEASMIVSRGGLDVSLIKARRGDSFLTAAGDLKGDVEALDFKNASVHAKSELNLSSMGAWALKTFPKSLAKLPALKGRAVFEAKLERKNGHDPEADFTASTSGLSIGQFIVDRLSTSGTYSVSDKTPMIKLPTLEIENQAGSATAHDLVIGLGETKTASGRLITQSLQVHELLKTLGVGTIPVFLQVSADLPCSGTIAPDLAMRCQGHARGENLLVRGSMKAKNTIAALRSFDADGEVTIDKEKVEYTAELSMPGSKGRSAGAIGYATGFKISYEADKLALADVTNLGDLKLEGSARLKGSTEGDSDAATFAMDIDGVDLWLEDFWLGNAKGTASYKAGNLAFTNMQGYYAVSRYSGEVKLDFHKDEIAIVGRVPFFDARDLMKVFSHRLSLPFAVVGTGQAQVRANGPLALNRLSYDLKSSLFKGSVAGETFDQAHFDVKSVGGEVKTERVVVNKGSAAITVSGQGHPDGTIKAAIAGRGLRLEDSVIVSGAGLALSGVVDFDMTMSGPVLAPASEMHGTLTKTSIGEQAMPDSNFRLKFGSKTLEGDGDFLGDVMKAAFTIPFDSSAPFALKLSSHDWNYAPLFAALAGPASKKDYEGRLSAEVDLAAATGGFWNSSGSIRIDNFLLSRGSLALRSTDPLALRLKNGHVHVDKFELAGEGNLLKVTANPQASAKVDLQLNGKLDMTLLGILTPFFEDLRGALSFAVNFRASPTSADLLGSAYVEKGYLKFFDFPHPLEEIRMDLLFNQKKILFNTVKADFGGGKISATGSMDVKGPKNYPVNVSGQFEKVTLEVPEKVRTSGSGNISFSGNWFPFLLKADYEIKEGLISKEFGGEGPDNSGIRRDQFLPELLLQERFVPVILDLGINFSKGLAIKNELIDGHVSGNLTVKGNPAKPSILGAVAIEKSSKLSVKDTVFEVQNASIQMNDPNEINPKLYITARSRVRDYDVNLLVQGNGNKPEYSFTSVPPLAEKEIISLLALGTTEQQINPVLQPNSQQQNQGPQANVGAIKNIPITKEIKEKTGFDLQFSPGFDEKAMVNKIVISRQFTNKFGVSASQSLGNKRSTAAEARYRINDRVSGILSWQNRDDLDTVDKSVKQDKEQNQLGLDLEYKFEFK